jgi:hypothetical protein
MVKHKIVKFEGVYRDNFSDEIEVEIEKATSDGWQFLQLATGGGGGGGLLVQQWVYLVFKRD